MHCPVCNSPYSAFVKKVLTARTHKHIDLYTCLECQSFWNPSGFIEDEAIQRESVEWGDRVAERNVRAAQTLFGLFDKIGIRRKRVVEIGCGIGTMVDFVNQSGGNGIGFDINPLAIEYGRNKHKADLRKDLWSKDSDVGPVDLIMAISVLEHVEQPRPLIFEMISAARAARGALFISVPMVNKDRWRYLVKADPKEKGTWLFDNDMHITHFSTAGLERVLLEGGATKDRLYRISEGLWHGFAASWQ